ncbi:hypothetical protein BN1708_005440 [Verticillium longisporum]|uniref:Uncharacterized protein n=1 Tax=Verticillium longisporum TaxID=100787 RepID=A0A0G4MAX3_VERLO|nr:hypothetical protein BN1708_005440 [Verticillium longisporum]
MMLKNALGIRGKPMVCGIFPQPSSLGCRCAEAEAHLN